MAEVDEHQTHERAEECRKGTIVLRISQIFGLGRTQAELDFVDVDPDRDLRLYLDPCYLALRRDRWSVSAVETFQTFFERFLGLARNGDAQQARALFQHLEEPNETCLGQSQGAPAGRGLGPTNAEDLFQSLMQSRAIHTGLVEDIEDVQLFVTGIGKDKTSDMVTNIIRGPIIEYTQRQARLWGIPLRPNTPFRPCWNPATLTWEQYTGDALVVGERQLLLVPKAVVTRADWDLADTYHRYYILDFLQDEHLRLGTALVRERPRKDGTVRRYVTKQDLADSVAPLTKAFLLEFSESHREVFARFKQHPEVSSDSLALNDLAGEELDLVSICDRLTQELDQIPPGNDAATRYHRAVAAVLELVFYPTLVNLQLEREINEGRKRIDLTFDNVDRQHVFSWLDTHHHVPCPYVLVECKNYGRDVANPEVDQLIGRFSPRWGKCGLLVSRSVENMPLLLSRCRDAALAEQGLVIPLVDEDLLVLLGRCAAGNVVPFDQLLRDRVRAILLA